MADPTFDTAAAHRWFAIETNNAVWAWLENHSDGELTDPIVHTAHASYYHWTHAGTTINQARAAVQVANVHATLGDAAMAAALAEACSTLLDQAGDEATDWDRAFALDSRARAAAAGGDPQAVEYKAQARAAGDAIADPDDKAVFDGWFSVGNWHGI